MNYLTIVFIVIAAIGIVHCCTSQQECSVPGTVCTDEQCVCNIGYVLSSNGSQCLPYVTEYNGDCSDQAQCEWLGPNSECNYVCRCQEGYRWYKGECKKYAGLGKKCSANLDCYDGYNLESLTCVNEICTCSAGYYKRGNNTDCRKIASKLEDICALDIDCQVPNTDTVCHIGKCELSTQELKENIEEELEETDFTYRAISEKPCTENIDCEDIDNSECYDKTDTCICKKGYFFDKDGTTCIPELGVDAGCTTDSDCVIKPGKCVNGVCYCRDYYFVAEGNQNCVKTISETNWNCLSREWCFALGNLGYCNSNGTCQCSTIADLDEENELCEPNGNEADPDRCTSDNECKYIQNGFCVDEVCGCRENNFIQDNVRCVPGIGAPCSETVVCEVENSICSDDTTCKCKDGYVVFEKSGCYEIRDHLGDQCEKDVQCSGSVTYSKCLEEKCSCDEEHLEHNNTCIQKKDFGSYCNNRLECSLSLSDSLGDSVECRNHMCQCPTGYTIKEDHCSSGSITVGNFLVMATVLLLKGVVLVS